jgi:hypothetical protein
MGGRCDAKIFHNCTLPAGYRMHIYGAVIKQSERTMAGQAAPWRRARHVARRLDCQPIAPLHTGWKPAPVGHLQPSLPAVAIQ